MPDAILEARRLTRRFGGLTAVSDVSLSLHADQIHAVIGPNGAGKSTLVNLLSGEIAPSAGDVLLAGHDITRHAPDRRARLGLGRSYQKTTIFPALSLSENVRLAAQAGSRHAMAFFRSAPEDRRIAEITRRCLADAGLDLPPDTPARQLSHGAQRQLEIAMVLAISPKLILLDEPLAGMGQREAEGIISLIARLRAGRAILLIEHDMDAVFALADHLTVMVNGRVIASGPPEATRAEKAVRQAYLGEDQPT